MAVWGRLMAATTAAVSTWRTYGAEPTIVLDGRYDKSWSYYSGTVYAGAVSRLAVDPYTRHRLYAGTRLLWNHTQAVCDFYGTHYALGALPTDGKPFPDNRPTALPIDAQTGSEATDDALHLAIGQLWQLWQWQNMMSLPPLYTAVLGDCLIELVDDVSRKKVMPGIVWPGYVTDIQVDGHVGNVKAYTLQYRVTQAAGVFYGKAQPQEDYTFRKEVDGEAFRYFKDDKPFDAYGEGAVVRNPYGFVPAVWLRFWPGWGVRSLTATEKTRQQLDNRNSFLSHAFDYQRKQFAAPIMLIGGNPAQNAQQRRVQLGQPPTEDTFDTIASALAQTLDFLPAREGGDIKAVNLDLGDTQILLDDIKDGIFNANPEGRFYEIVGSLSQATGPGIERAAGDVINRMKRFRNAVDPHYIKIFQMAIAIMGWRIKNGDYGPLLRWHEPFRPYDLLSFGLGALDCAMLDRPVVPETETEKLTVEQLRATVVLTRKQLATEIELVQAGVSEDEAREIIVQRRAAAEEAARRFEAGQEPGEGADDDEEAFGGR